MSLKTANKICGELSRQYGITNIPEVIQRKYSRIGKCCILGQYHPDTNQIDINKHILENWPEKPMSEVISHELMHAKCYQEIPDYSGTHCKQFREICRLSGIDKRVWSAKKTD